MAGIGFKLRDLLKNERSLGLLRAYTYAGIISSGPWVLSIMGVMAIGVLSLGIVVPSSMIVQFLVSVTYLMALSLVLTSTLQLTFTRFVADRLFENKHQLVLPNLLGALTLTTLVSSLLGFLLLAFFFEEPLFYRILMFAAFVILSDVWIIAVFLNGMKEYRNILMTFFIGYGIAVIAALLLRPYGLNGLLGGFVLGQAVLMFLLLYYVIRDYPARRLISFDFLHRRQAFYSLTFTGLFFNLGVWADKFLFWINPSTSEAIIGSLRASYIYDLPIFLAYLSIIPGMAVFLVRMETDFSEQYESFYTAVREGETLVHMERIRNNMVFIVRQGIFEIFKIQGLTILFLILFGPAILDAFGISILYMPLFNIDLVGVGLQVLFMAVLNVYFYLDLRKLTMFLCALFLICNIILTLISQALGPIFYGYGFALALVLSNIVGLGILSRKLDNLEYTTFMLQRPYS